jgi:hypothetical protein
MRLARPSRPLAALLLTAACATGGVAAPPAPTPGPGPETPPRPASPAGFDTYYYPGDPAMRAWREASPYSWVGYYLPAPCHRETSWQGRRAALQAMGWEIAVLFVGQQTWEGQAQVVAPTDSTRADSTRPDSVGVAAAAAAPACAPSQLTAERGAADAAAAVAAAAADGFPPGTTIYLDVERMETVPAAMRAYYRAWTRGVAADGRYRVGIYAHARNAEEILRDVRAEIAEAGRTTGPEFWIANTAGFDFLTAVPSGSGHPFATVWQGRLDVQETWGGVPLRIDVNVSTTPTPSGPFTVRRAP